MGFHRVRITRVYRRKQFLGGVKALPITVCQLANSRYSIHGSPLSRKSSSNKIQYPPNGVRIRVAKDYNNFSLPSFSFSHIFLQRGYEVIKLFAANRSKLWKKRSSSIASSIIKISIFRFTCSKLSTLHSVLRLYDKSYFALPFSPFLFTLRFLPGEFHPLSSNTNFLSALLAPSFPSLNIPRSQYTSPLVLIIDHLPSSAILPPYV